MLTRIEIRNLKCFQELELPCAPLNLLCGLNGTGKSSLIQALLLLRQSVESGALDDCRLDLAGHRIDLGTANDVIHDGNVDPYIQFSLTESNVSHCWEHKFERRTDESASGGRLEGFWADPDSESVLANHCRWVSSQPFAGLLLYVPAERVGPRKTYPESATHSATGDFGPSGEFAWNYLVTRQRRLLSDSDPRVPEGNQRLLIDVFDHWLQTVSPGAHLELEQIDRADVVVPGFGFDQPGEARTRPYRATNVGFGLSYTLPVILALLSEPGTLALIENPEAHLHPRGQTRLGELAARAAVAGVQVFVETHSDHFMDGVRIAVKEGLIAPDDVKFNYFEREGNEASVTTPEIDRDGRLSEWPQGFFDQAGENLDRLLAPRS